MTELRPAAPRLTVCWVEHPAEPWHCTLPVGHDGPHWHAYSKTEWPQPMPPARGGRATPG